MESAELRRLVVRHRHVAPMLSVVLAATDARVAIIEFGDYQCPFCGQHANQTLPQIIANYVKTGTPSTVDIGVQGGRLTADFHRQWRLQ